MLLARLRLVPLALWAGHASIAYGFVAVDCHVRAFGPPSLAPTGVRVALIVFTLAALAVSGLVAVLSVAAWRSREEDANGRRGFTAAFTGAIAAASVVYLTWSLVLIAAADVC